LENCIESAVIFADDEISPSDLSLPRANATQTLRAVSPPSAAVSVEDEPSLAELERRYIAQLLEKHDGNRSVCAQILGIGRNTLLRKLRGTRNEE
jgi:DNA-binding NtrC family response regulator